MKVRHQGKPVIALGVSMAKGGDIIALGKALRAKADELRRDLPAGIELTQVQDQPRAVSRSVGEFVRVLIEAIVVVLAVSFISLGLHTKPLRIDFWPGLVVGITIPLVLAITFVTMFYWGVGLHKISLGSLIIALGLLVDDAIIAVEMMVRKLEEGYDKKRAATFAYEITVDADAHRHADHRGGLPADRPGQVGDRRVHLRDLRGHLGRAADLVAGVGVLRAVPRRHAAAHAQLAPGRRGRTSCSTRRSTARFRALRELVRAAPLDHDRR